MDVFAEDDRWEAVSRLALKRARTEGDLVACEAVWAELCPGFPDTDPLLRSMNTVGVGYLPLIREAALLAGEMWRRYLGTGGSRERIVADFLIGAHALRQADRLLTRDRGFYRRYFTGLRLLEP